MKFDKIIKNGILATSLMLLPIGVQARNVVDTVKIVQDNGISTIPARFNSKTSLEEYLKEFLPKNEKIKRIEVKGPNNDEYNISKKDIVSSINKYVIENNVPQEVSIVVEREGNKMNVENGSYTFDLNLDGHIDDLKILKINNKYFVEGIDNQNKKYIMSLDRARFEILNDLRFTSFAPRDAAKLYSISSGNQGREVVKFLFETNKISDDKYCLAKNKCTDIKFKTLEGLITAIDKTANGSERADYIDKNIFEAYKKSGGMNNKILDKINAYSNTFGTSVPEDVLLLRFTLGSAIYATISSDYLPTVQENKALARARGSMDAVNYSNLRNNLTSNEVVKCYDSTKKMYEDQLKASENKVRRVNF